MSYDEALRQLREKKWQLERENIKKIKKQQKKEQILFVLISVFIITTSIILLCKLNDDAIKDCMSLGWSERVCQRNV